MAQDMNLSYVSNHFNLGNPVEAARVAKTIADSYLQMRSIAGSNEKALDFLNADTKIFGKRLDMGVVDAALKYAKGTIGIIDNNQYKSYLQERQKEQLRQSNETTAPSLETVVAGDKGAHGTQSAVYNGNKGNHGSAIPQSAAPNNVVDLASARGRMGRWTSYAGRVAAGIAAAAVLSVASPTYYNNRNSVTYTNHVYAAAVAPGRQGSGSVPPEAGGSPPAQTPAPAAQAPATSPAPAVPPPSPQSKEEKPPKPEEKPAAPEARPPVSPQTPAASAPAVQTPTVEKEQAPKYKSSAVQETDVKGYKWQFNQATDEHEKFRKGEVKYADLSDRVKSWFSLRHPAAELKQESNQYSIAVTPKTAYKGEDLGNFRFGVKVGGEWHYGLKPNEVANISLTKKVYGALKGAKRPVAQVIFYKSGEGKIVIHSSLNHERREEKPVAVVSEALPKKPGVPFRLEHLRGN